ncbi:hypothetical protein EHQ27_16685 [Leptospira wolffii]|uniref:hypothetical protein n=1 Tax=Leptospira wolffii TaxID=409998 RepID=UPI0010828928|nr:hypothetical protein [Leptospira wolffii]TGK62229.1 hypothetical protein EHQ32_05200 [Leptospira wolffii]TGK66601.1 hypothetical protein EHQ27_16685 [Leptospira wolffii]TGK74387.1 hypothetical protein EHQ35_08575 [Leptospira wolffii]TGL32038.1 hypothetical protein EHQ57_04100 [Leptospira wolffii]
MGKSVNQSLSMKEEIGLRKSDPNWSKNIASCVVRRHKEESETKGKVISFPMRNVLAAAAVLLVSVSIGWFAITNVLPPEDEVMHGISFLFEGDSYLSSLEE